MATADQYAEWIVKNQGRKGTPEFETVAKAYQEAKNDAPAQESRSVAEDLGRQGGLTLRAGLKGAVALPAMVADAASGAVNAGLDVYDDMRSPSLGELVTGKQKGFRFQKTASAMDNLMDRAGVAQPETATERVVQDIVGAGVGTGGMVKAGRFLVNNAAPIVQKVGQVFSAGPGMQTAAAATGAGAAGVIRESGGGAGAQTAAAVLGSVAPQTSVAAGSNVLRTVMRGGEQGRQRVNDNIRLFKDAADTTPSVGQATEGRFPRAIESVLAKTPGSAGVMQRAAQAKADAMSKSVIDTADSLAPGASAVNAGEAIEKGVNGFKDGFKVVQQRLYNTLDKHIAPDAPIPVGNTEFKLKELNAGIEGAPNISEFFKNSKIKGIDKALQADLELSANGGVLPYEAVKKLRTLIGNEIADNSLLSDVPRSKWTALYGALSEDLGMAAKKAGPQAEQSWQWANTYTRSQLERLEQLSKVVGKDSPEKIFNAAMAGTAEGNTILKRVVDAIPKENRKELASAVLRRMGQATAGNQNAVGDAFSSETFLTNVNKLSPAARSTLFGRLGLPEAPNKLAQLAQMAGNMREGSKVFANPSGTQQAVSTQTMGLGSVAALLTGNPGFAAAAGGTMVGANLLAKKMNDPSFVKWLGKKTELSPSVTASEVNALAQLMNR
jgi:hypothetical protein